jgi:hypothetical protein
MGQCIELEGSSQTEPGQRRGIATVPARSRPTPLIDGHRGMHSSWSCGNWGLGDQRTYLKLHFEGLKGTGNIEPRIRVVLE